MVSVNTIRVADVLGVYEQVNANTIVRSSATSVSINHACVNTTTVCDINSVSTNNYESHQSVSRRSSETIIGTLDSAASHYISKVESDFEWISDRVGVKLNAADGKVDEGAPCAKVARCRPNRLGITAGIYFSRLPSSVTRLISTGGLRADGWTNHQEPGENTSYLSSDRADDRIPMRYEDNGFPMVTYEVGVPRRIECPVASINACGGVNAVVMVTALQKHQRLGHLSLPGRKIKCQECDLAKGSKTSFRKERPDRHKRDTPLYQLNTDYYGPMTPESIRGCTMFMVFICDAVSHVWVFPIRHKNECVEICKKLVEQIRAKDGKDLHEKVVHIIRSDNEPVLRSSELNDALDKLGVVLGHSVPYSPQMNGVIERFMRTFGNGLRAILIYVDRRLWCYAGEFLAFCWNRVPRDYSRAPKYNGKTPIQAVKMRDPEAIESAADNVATDGTGRHLRRFGCLSYVMMQPRESVKKLSPKYQKMVFLGYSKSNNSAWLFGGFLKDDRCTVGYRWAEIESIDAKFCEDVLISDIDQLKPDATAAEQPQQVACSPRNGGAVAPVAQLDAQRSAGTRCSGGQAEVVVPEVEMKVEEKAKKKTKNKRQRKRLREKEQGNYRVIACLSVTGVNPLRMVAMVL